MVFRVPIQTFAETMGLFVTTVRGRYIVEFPRPKNATSGSHEISVKIDHGGVDFIRAAGVMVPLPDQSVTADPATVIAGPKDAPEMGGRHTVKKPQ
jgi:hypothetical protein